MVVIHVLYWKQQQNTVIKQRYDCTIICIPCLHFHAWALADNNLKILYTTIEIILWTLSSRCSKLLSLFYPFQQNIKLILFLCKPYEKQFLPSFFFFINVHLHRYKLFTGLKKGFSLVCWLVHIHHLTNSQLHVVCRM